MFQQNLRLEFEKKRALDEIIFADPWLDSHQEVSDDINIDQLLDKKHND